MTQENLFSESGWIITDKDLPPKRDEKKYLKDLSTSGDKYLSKPIKKEEGTEPQKQDSVKPKMEKEKEKEKEKKKDKQLRVMIIGAHPDDADYLSGGLAISLTREGHRVKFVAMTNGDIGHQTKSPEELAFIRSREAVNSARALGAEYECLGIHDGHVFVNEENTRKVVKVIREFAPDMIITHRPYDYHRDHRYTGQLVMDASYMLIVPHYYPEFPPQTREMPVICYAFDKFKKPYPFRIDVLLNIDDVYDAKIKAIANHESQFFEWLPWTIQMEGMVTEETDLDKRLELVGMVLNNNFGPITEKYFEFLKRTFPEKKNVSFEAYEICEYGKQPKKSELKKLFPGAYFVKEGELDPFNK